jgi:site-specific DNA-methyltransferase (adenine-specific)
MPDASVDSIVTDPPYGLSFMGKRWDYDVPSEEIWRECLRVLKPGGHLLAFAGTRTQHRMAVRIEDAGFEIRDMIAWVYGSGFPKSMDVSKAIDKAAGAEGGRGPMKRGGERLARLEDGKRDGEGRWGNETSRDPFTYLPATPAAQQWEGWGTALKPALEPITMARKPLCGTVAENVLTHGTGAINVDGCRVDGAVTTNPLVRNVGGFGSGGLANQTHPPKSVVSQGRWPANLIHDGSNEVVGLFPQTGVSAGGRSGHTSAYSGGFKQEHYGDAKPGFGDSGSAARFFYCAKASKKDRDEGCEGLEERASSSMSGRRDCDNVEWKADNDVTGRFVTQRRNHHPTVKPTALMRYLCRLVTPPSGTVLDPFMGSGSTGKAAVLEGFSFIGIEREAEYVEIAKARITAAEAKSELPLFAA